MDALLDGLLTEFSQIAMAVGAAGTSRPIQWCTHPTDFLAVGGFGSAIRASMLPAETGLPEFFPAVAPWLTSFAVTSAAMQVISSLLIAWKVWAVVVRDTDSKARSCSFVSAECASLRVGIESGVLRALCGITLVPFVNGDSMGAVVVAAVACQIDVSEPDFIHEH